MLLVLLAAEAASQGEVLDAARWRALVQEHGPFLQRSLTRLGTSGAHVDDLVQETFVTAYRKRDDLPGEPALMRAWLYRTAKNHWLHHRRGTARRLTRHETVAAEPEAPAATPEEHLARNDDAGLLRAALEQLNDDMREAVVLVELEEMSATAAAELLELEENAFRSRLRRGRQRLTEVATAMLSERDAV